MKYILFLTFVTCTHSLCDNSVTDKTVETKTMKYKYNIVGIAGEWSDKPYIEIEYSKDDGNGRNIIVKEMVSPPFAFGGHFVNIGYDSIISYMGGKAVSYSSDLIHDYGANGAEYLRIINHSDDKPVEFFIAGAQDMKTYKDGCKGLDAITTIPNVYYKNEPIYYLLFPDQKYNKNLVKHSYACDDVFYFEGVKCGSFDLTSAWDVNAIARLYRAEFNNSKDTILYIDPELADNYGRMNKTLSSNNPYLGGKTVYGTVKPKEVLKGNDKIWLLASPRMFDSVIGHGEL